MIAFLVGAGVGMLLAPDLAPPHVEWVWNASPSIPTGLYRLSRASRIHTGDLVAVRPSPVLETFMAERRYVERGALLLKPVAAVAGSTVCRSSNRITIDGRTVAQALSRDRAGRALPHWSGCRQLEPTELLLLATDHADSFDSRYFGPVRLKQVVGQAHPLWTYQ